LTGLEASQAIGGSLYLLTSAAVGIRLLDLARRNRTLPELLLGIGFITAATVGSVIEAIAVVRVEHLAAGQIGRLLLVAKISALFGMAAHNLFTWRVFRPDATWATVLAFSLIAIAIAALGGLAASGTFSTGVSRGAWFWIEFATRVATPFWLGLEATRYHLQMKRRMRLGLADPVVTDRFLLWALASLFGILLLATSLPPAFFPREHTFMQLALLIFGFSGVAYSISYGLAFFPPEAYRRRVCARAPVQS
jgi:hypothetical protein